MEQKVVKLNRKCHTVTDYRFKIYYEGEGDKLGDVPTHVFTSSQRSVIQIESMCLLSPLQLEEAKLGWEQLSHTIPPGRDSILPTSAFRDRCVNNYAAVRVDFKYIVLQHYSESLRNTSS